MFFFNDTATTEIYTLSLHDALPISHQGLGLTGLGDRPIADVRVARLFENGYRIPLRVGIVPRAADELAVITAPREGWRSEEHTSELQSRQYLVCRLLLEKKKTLQSQ